MRRHPLASLAVALPTIAFLAACATPGAGDRDSEIVMISLAFDTSSGCRARLSGRDFTLPADEGAFFEALRSRAKAAPEASVTGGETLPYECYGRAVLFVQHAGFRRVGFVAEPPPGR